MQSIQVGDLVRRIRGKNKGMRVGDSSEVIEVNETTVQLEDYDGNHLISALEVVESNNASCTAEARPKMLKRLNVFIKKYLDPNLQSLLKAGYYNGDLKPTTAGDRALLDMLHMENQEKLAALANAEIAEIEAEDNE